MRCSNLLRIILCGAVMGICSQASAHFIFVVPDAAGEKVQVVMSEGLEPDLEMNSGMVRSSELQWKAADGKAQSLAPKSEGDETALVAAIPGKGNRVVFGKVDFGVMQRGASKAHWLVYFPKTIIGNPFDEKNTVDADRPVEIVPVGKSGETKLKLLVQGKPAANTELTVILPGGAEEKHTTDDAGLTKALPAAGRYGAWARNWKEQSGTAGDKKYEEVRNYATLVFDVPRADGSKVMVDTKLAAKTSTKKAHGNPHAKAHGNPHANPHAKGHAATGNNPHAKAHGNPHANPHKNPHGDDTATVGDSDDEGGFHTGQKKATAISDTVKPFATMPQAASSFGAAAMDGWLYVYGGHIVTPHEYHTGAVSGQFHRLDLSDSKTWEKLPDSTP
ncbi:MAG: hypothetical protein SGJ20_20225, partial [Planctomycetota bacterium]|nr:hypothetical protein [Planctomycetota bacterium]